MVFKFSEPGDQIPLEDFQGQIGQQFSLLASDHPMPYYRAPKWYGMNSGDVKCHGEVPIYTASYAYCTWRDTKLSMFSEGISRSSHINNRNNPTRKSSVMQICMANLIIIINYDLVIRAER